MKNKKIITIFFILTFFITTIFSNESNFQKPFVVLNEGITSSWITRIIEQENRSNFVFQDFLIGAYVSAETRNMQPIDSFIRIAVFYPISHKFNSHPQSKKNMLNFAFDFIAAPILRLPMWNIATVRFGAGLHFLYQMGDRWNFINLGIVGITGLELPLTKYCTILLNGTLSADYGNFGTNKIIEPYDNVWQYQLEIGIRYSKKSPNRFHYIK